jgi:hypothetical protein
LLEKKSLERGSWNWIPKQPYITLSPIPSAAMRVAFKCARIQGTI